MTKELVIHENRIDEAADRGDSDSQMKKFRGHYASKTPISYESPIVKCLALPRLAFRGYE